MTCSYWRCISTVELLWLIVLGMLGSGQVLKVDRRQIQSWSLAEECFSDTSMLNKTLKRIPCGEKSLVSVSPNLNVSQCCAVWTCYTHDDLWWWQLNMVNMNLLAWITVKSYHFTWEIETCSVVALWWLSWYFSGLYCYPFGSTSWWYSIKFRKLEILSERDMFLDSAHTLVYKSLDYR